MKHKANSLNIIALLGVLFALMNAFTALLQLNIHATVGWIVALCWFPYQHLALEEPEDLTQPQGDELP